MKPTSEQAASSRSKFRSLRANSITSLREFIALLIQRFISTRCPEVAGSLTFTTLLAIVPLITVSLALFSNFPAFSELGSALSAFLQNNILPEAAGQITIYALEFSEKATNLTLIGTAMLIVTVLLLLHTIDGVFNDIWGVRQPRPLLTRITVYWVALTLGPVALAGSIYATGQLVASSIALVGETTHTVSFTTNVVPLALLGSLFSFLYFAVPNHPVRLLHAMAGGFAAALGFIAMQRLFGLFIALSPSYTLVYGAFAALPIFLLWLYTSWVVVLLGAILAATFPEFFERKQIVQGFPGDRAWAAVNMLVLLANGLKEGKTVTFKELRNGAGTTHDLAETLLGEMRDAGWVARSEDETWLLSTHPDTLTLTEVIQRFALSPAHWLAASGAGRATARAAEHLRNGLVSSDLTLTDLATAAVEAAEDESQPQSRAPD